MKSLASLEKTQLKARLKTKTSQHPWPPPLEWMKRNTPPFFDFLELLHGCYDFLRNSGKPKTFWAAKVLLPTKKGRVGLVVRALAFHQCGLGSISALGVIRGLSLLVLYSAMRGFPPGTPVFPFHLKPTFDLI